ncbi:MAG: [protein-PII] uridylyltransferase [Polyangiaceae bacterium]
MPTRALSPPDPIAAAALKGAVLRMREVLDAQVDAAGKGTNGDDGAAVGRAHARELDALLSQSFTAAEARAAHDKPLFAALVAVGSYGRGAVALRSDVDVKLIVRQKNDRANALADALLYPLWDAGLSVGHQVTTADEAIDLAKDDLATATSLLDLRQIAGDPAIVHDIEQRAWGGIFAEGALPDFLDRLEAEVAQRNERFGGSVYLLEPDVKNGAGGMRDLDVARWAVRARFRAGAEDRGAVWGDLVRLGVLVAREAREIEQAEEFLWRVRNRLHRMAGRRSDRLTFDAQEAIAVAMGLCDFHEHVPRESRGLVEGDPESHEARAAGAERLMQKYYVRAREITRAQERLLERARPPKKRGKPVEIDLGDGIKLFDGQVTFAAGADLSADPALAFRLYSACVRRDAPVLAFARDTITRAAGEPAWCERLRASEEATNLFVDLVCTVQEVKTRRGSMVGELHDVGLLLAMIPEFSPVTGRVHHDTYHVYTVDVHSVAAVDCLRALARGEMAHEHPLASRIAAEIARPRALFLATLLHDVGKGYPDATGSRKNHSESGALLCDRILPRLGLDAGETEQARAIVNQHLAMYHVASRRDLDDPSTIEEFCRVVQGRQGLRDLYLCTVADITTTSPAAMTSWKARMLEELFVAADSHLKGVAPPQADEQRVQHARESATKLWQALVNHETRAPEDRAGSKVAFAEFVASMPERYLLANAPEAIARHAGLALERAPGSANAGIVSTRHPEIFELCVVTDDRPGLLASIAAAITANRLEVLAAQVYSRGTSADGIEAVDLFWVRDRVDPKEGPARALPRLLRDLGDLTSGRVDDKALLRTRIGASSSWRERPSPNVPTEIVMDDRASRRHTVIEVFAKDRPGLLYTLAQTLHDMSVSIVLSKINTEGTRVADVFYVTELNGTKVEPGPRFKAIRDALSFALERQSE